MTEERYYIAPDVNNQYSIYDRRIQQKWQPNSKEVLQEICDKLNKQDRRIKELEKKIQSWQDIALKEAGNNTKLRNELNISKIQENKVDIDIQEKIREEKLKAIKDD